MSVKITAHGKTYESVEQAREMIATLQHENAAYGASDGRVTEILSIQLAIATRDVGRGWGLATADEEPITDLRTCVCARHGDGSVTTLLCPSHADTDPCLIMSQVTGKRRKGTIRRGVCSACGHGARRDPDYDGRLAGDVEDVWEVVKEEYGMPCEHPSCAILHKHLAKEPYADGGWHWEVAEHNGREVNVHVNRWHEKKVVEWVILLNGKRVGDAHNTKREALAEAASKPRI